MFVLDPLADAFAKAAGQVLTLMMTWWLQTPSPIEQVTQARSVNNLIAPIAITILTVTMLARLGRMMISGRREDAIEIGQGLLKFGLINGAALLVINLSLSAADELSRLLIADQAAQFSERLNAAFDSIDASPALRLLLGFAVAGFSIIQWLLLLLRQASILILIVLLPLAASGVLTNATRRWFPTMVGWLVALIAYKPMAALIYAIGMGLVSEGDDIMTIMTGIVVLCIAVVALPAAMKFFSWAGVGVSGGSSAGGVVAAAATGAASVGALGSSRRQEMTGPGSSPSWAQGAGSPPAAGGALPALPAGGGTSSAGAQPGGSSPSGGFPSGGTPPSSPTPGGGQGAGRGSAGASGGPGSGATPSSTGVGGVAPSGPGTAGGGMSSGAAAAAAGPVGASGAAVNVAAGTASQMGRAATDQFTTPPADETGGARPSKGPEGAGPAGGDGDR
ncbi:hypothetical protein [Pseudonocardia alni]|uniref:hypothetical protein n=1 Tax=Pseudonocardia alni TaxID=33907 RepID=UPI00280AE9A9|nr:hypothetical protein [Pseudonocardia alni]